MAYELYIFPAETGPKTISTETIIKAFEKADFSCSEEPDDFGHWLVLKGFESALDLTVENGLANGANFRYAMEDDDSMVQRIAEVFKGVGWLVHDEEGEL